MQCCVQKCAPGVKPFNSGTVLDELPLCLRKIG
jgi:hypothetical protein